MQNIRFYLHNPYAILAGFAFHFPFLFSPKKYLEILARPITGYKLNIENPETFCEKIQWLKLHDHNPMYHSMVDKIEAKQYAKKNIGCDYVLDNIQIWHSVDDITLDQLPDKFVLKCSTGGGNNGVVLCLDKSNFNLEQAKRRLSVSAKSDIFRSHLEWAYKDIKPRYFAEPLLLLFLAKTLCSPPYLP